MKLKSKIIIIIAILCLGYIIMTPSEYKVLKQIEDSYESIDTVK